QGAKSMQCFPLRTAWIYGHMRLTQRILHQQILGEGASAYPDPWSVVSDTGARPFQSRGILKFNGSADTDGVSISLLFETEKAIQQAKERAKKSAATREKNKTARAAVSALASTSSVKPTPKRKRKRNPVPKSCTDPSQESPYIDNIDHKVLLDTENKCVLMDPGRRDLHTW
ncbi:hypothetical protein LPJ57_006402, partial [Coemansia sp. RSA 486]